MRLIRMWPIIALSAVVIGCAAPSAIPVVERKQPPSEKINHHWVAQGETLYAIAWRYNLDVERLARANRLTPDGTIYVGQVLRLDVDAVLRAQRSNVAPTVEKSPPKAGRSTAVKRSDNELQQLAGRGWRWPVSGKVLRSFSYRNNQGHKGIDIQARTGQSVYASQGGVVVYSGNGLAAYGNLLIVKHADRYLSAYAHNSRLVVSEGERVKQGQKIAEAGKTGTHHEHLHFEIRRQGKPVNPQSLLPRHSG